MMHTLKAENAAGFYTMLSRLYRKARLVCLVSLIMVLTSIGSDGQVYIVDDVRTTQAMQVLDIDNMPVDPRFLGP